MARDTQIVTLASNRRARHDYEILDRFEAGIALAGTEVKSVREGRVQLKDSFVEVAGGEAWLVGVHITGYAFGNRQNHEPERRRKLLLHRKEIDRIFGRTTIDGQTCVPLSMYLKGNRVKVEIALARGRKHHDKRQQEREKELDREAREAMAPRRR